MPWFGVRSFYGHLWHLVASAIATQDIDSRDWMHADAPASLTRQIARVLGEVVPGASSVTEALGRDLFIDYIADTGDDVEVSGAVAELIVREYAADGPDGAGEMTLPRGDILLFGGDTAYPVATVTEIEARLLGPLNRVLGEHDDGKKRVLLGIPGNHDWFDGLDGFARMFRARMGPLEDGAARSPTGEGRKGAAPGAERPVRHFVSWMEAFAMGKHLVKRRALPVVGYEPVQRASYFACALAPGIDLWGVDRQLRQVNFQQRRFFWERRSSLPGQSLLLCLPDPLRAHWEPNGSGMGMLRALGLNPLLHPMLCIAGDVHHYERWEMGPSVHLIAGGGGAFLHGARVARTKRPPPLVEFPGSRTTHRLLRSVPWRVASGRAGLLPHLALAVLFAPALAMGMRNGPAAMDVVSVGAAALVAVVCALLGGWRRRGFRVVAALAGAVGAVMALLPTAAVVSFGLATHWLAVAPQPRLEALLVFAMSVFGGALVFGYYLAALARWGLNHDQAFAALGHPGFKHFVRMRVRADGSAVDAWVIGLVDPLGDATPVLIDRVTFRCSEVIEASESMPQSARITQL